MAGRLPLIALAACLAAGCDRSPEPERSASANGDPYADGRRLEQATARSAERWAKAPELPPCTELLEGSRGAVCDAARAALTKIRGPRGADAKALRDAADVALAAHRAAEELRRDGLEALAEQRKATGGAPAPSSAPTPSSRARATAPSALASADREATRSHDDPQLRAITAYSRLSKLGLRELATYLENGPLATRRRATAELVRLKGEEPRWSGLFAIVSEAALVEPNRELKRELEALKAELAGN